MVIPAKTFTLHIFPTAGGKITLPKVRVSSELVEDESRLDDFFRELATITCYETMGSNFNDYEYLELTE